MLPAPRAQSTTFSTRAVVSPLLRGCESRHFSKTTALNMLRLATAKEMVEGPCGGAIHHAPRWRGSGLIGYGARLASWPPNAGTYPELARQLHWPAASHGEP